MVRFSIVVPLDRQTAGFDETLASVLRNRPDNCQIIVPHFGQYDDPYGLDKEVDFCTVHPTANPGGRLANLLNAGLTAARGKLVGFFRPGTLLEEGWEEGLENLFQPADVGSVVPVLVDCESRNKVLAAGVETANIYNRGLCGGGLNVKRLSNSDLQPVSPTSWAGFYRKNLLTSVGGFDETIETNYLDLDVGLSLNFLGFHSVLKSDWLVAVGDAEDVLREAETPHGQSAQRAWTRFTETDEEEIRQARKRTVFWEVVRSCGNWNRLRHAWQRKSAEQFMEADAHHFELLSLLWKQRERLTAPALHAHVAAARDRQQSFSSRRAA
jgi:hypothetical protein